MNAVKFFCCVSALFVSVLFSASEPVIMQLMRSKSQLDYYVENYPVVVAFCFALPEHNQHKEQEIKRVYKVIQQAMRTHADDYASAHVKFVAVNRSVSDLVSLTKQYGFNANDSYLIFFKFGQAVSMKKLPATISAQKINAFIASRQREKVGNQRLRTHQMTAPRAMSQPVSYDDNEEYDQNDEHGVCKHCFESETDLAYCENRICQNCRCKYKRPRSMYDQPEFAVGPDHLYGIPYSYNYGNYWGGTITNPIN